MVRNYDRKTEAYNKEDMNKAIKAVQDGEMGYKKAASLFGVKRETLRDQVRQRYKKLGSGRATHLTAEEEEEIAECLKIMARWGFGFTQSEVIQLVGEYAASLDSNPFKAGLPTHDWLSGFMKRHPTLTRRLPEQLKAARAKSSANAKIVEEWFQLVKETLEANGLMNSPHRINNVDETGMPLDLKRIKVVCEKNISHLFRVIGGSGRESITVNGCARADGFMLPPYVIYAAKNLRSAWMEGGPDKCRYTVSDKGWMDSICFLDWFEKLFIPSLPEERPVVLIFDGHKSHISIPLIQSAVKNNIILLKLPPNSTHTLQPLDVGVYGPLNTSWEKILISFARQNLGAALTKEVFPSLLNKLWTAGCSNPENIKAGFSRCGIFPFKPDAVPRSQYELAEIFDKVAPTDTTSSASAPPYTPSSRPATPSEPSPISNTSSRPATPTVLETAPEPSIKNFFMKKISPMLQAKRDQSKRKTVTRQYGESLTSVEYIERMTREEEEKQNKQKGKGKGKRSVKKPPVVVDSDSELDDDRDYYWIPPKRRKHDHDDGSNSDSDSDNSSQLARRNLFENFM